MNREVNMVIDDVTKKSANLHEIDALINPISQVGKKYKKNPHIFKPGEEKEAEQEYSQLSFLINLIKKQKGFVPELTSLLMHIESIEITFSRAKSLYTLEVNEIQQIKQFVFYLNQLFESLKKYKADHVLHIPPFDELFIFLDKDGHNSPAFHLSDSYSDDYSSHKQSVRQLIRKKEEIYWNTLEQAKEELDLADIEPRLVVSRQNKPLLEKLSGSPRFYPESENFANCIFKLRKTEEILALEEEIKKAERKLSQAEIKVRELITKVISVYATDLFSAGEKVAKFDYLLARALFGVQNQCCIPEVTKNSNLYFEDAINIPTKKSLEQSGMKYQPVGLKMQRHVAIITGSNMGGKTTILKTSAQLIYCLIHAIPTPCKRASLPLVDFIFFSGIKPERMDLSSFASEIVAINEALQKPGSGLFLLDEFARGTNPQEGSALSRALIKYLKNSSHLVLCATHFSELSQFKSVDHFRVIGLTADQYRALDLQRQDILSRRLQELHKYMNYELEAVEADSPAPRAALMIADILGINEEIIKTATSYLENKENK
jgi:DNA mismatch repair ATPase MutS